MDTELLFKTLNLIAPLSLQLQERLRASVDEHHYKRKQLLQCSGETADRIYFVVNGLVRGFYLQNNREHTTWFRTRGELAVSAHSFFEQEPADEFIELMENSQLLSLRWSLLQGIYADFPEFNFHARMLTEKYLVESEHRAVMLRNPAIIERYQLLAATQQGLLNRVPLKVIATYLNVSHETLCRVRARHLR